MRQIENILIEKFTKVELFCISQYLESYTDGQWESGILPWNTKKDMAWTIAYYFKNTYVETGSQALDYIKEKDLNPDPSDIRQIKITHGSEPW